MRSLILLEVHHGEDTDALQRAVESIHPSYLPGLHVENVAVRVDLPPCFVLDSGNTESKEN